MERRKFTREYKLEAVKLIKDRGVSYAQAADDLGVHPTQLREWVKKFADDPQHAFPGQGQMKPEQQEITHLRREVAKLKAERDILKKAAADSTGRRNALFVDLREVLVKRLSRCFPTQRLSRSAIERGGDRRKRIGAMSAEIGAFRKVLAQQPVGVLIGATLPRALRIAEVDLDTSVNLQTRMLRHLRSLIPGQ
jgi:transposase